LITFLVLPNPQQTLIPLPTQKQERNPMSRTDKWAANQSKVKTKAVRFQIAVSLAAVALSGSMVACGDGGGSATTTSQVTASPQITTTTLPAGATNLGYSQTVQGAGGSGTGYTWTVSAGTLPPGLTLLSGTPNATISGISTTAGPSNFTLRLQDSNGQTATQALSLTVNTAMVRIVAGVGTAGFSGDGGQATAAELNTPSGIVVDALGNLLIADQLNNRIRSVNAQTQVITSVAGTITGGFNGDGPALATQLNSPGGLALDATGNWIFADSGNQLLRRVNTLNMQVSTLAGTQGAPGFSDAPVQFNNPAGIAIEGAGTVLVADALNHRVRRINLQTGVATTVAGTGIGGYNNDNVPAVTAQLNMPTGVAVDGAGNIFIADSLNQRVRRVDAISGQITTVAGTGILGFNGDNQNATLAHLAFPLGVGVDAVGNVLVADSFNNRVRLVNIQSGEISTIAGDGTSAQVNGPFAVAVDAVGNVYFTEAAGNRVGRVGQ
jgi:sugar lactone lactonase YvrE